MAGTQQMLDLLCTPSLGLIAPKAGLEGSVAGPAAHLSRPDGLHVPLLPGPPMLILVSEAPTLIPTAPARDLSSACAGLRFQQCPGGGVLPSPHPCTQIPPEVPEPHSNSPQACWPWATTTAWTRASPARRNATTPRA